MTWGPCFMYYQCAACGMKFKYSIDLISRFGPAFGCCPHCLKPGILVKEGARTKDDEQYVEVE